MAERSWKELIKLSEDALVHRDVMFKKFYMVAVQTKDGSMRFDTHGNRTMGGNGPKSIFPTYERAMEACEALLKSSPNRKFIVLESTEIVEVDSPPLKKSKM